jgi:hypothetical protein
MKKVLLLLLFFMPLIFQACEDKKEQPEKKKEAQTIGKNKLELPGLLSIESPEDGYQWIKKSDDVGGHEGSIYICAKSGNSKVAVLGIINAHCEGDDRRLAALTGAYIGFIKTFERYQYKIIETQEPSKITPIPNQVTYFAQGKKQDGTQVNRFGTEIFGKNTFHLEVEAQSKDEAKDFHNKILKSFKELDQ